jgi:hypothetical protein
MADKDSTLYAGRKTFVDARDSGGNDLTIRISHTVASDANGDRVFLVEFPANCQVVDGVISWDALGASTTMSIGDTTSGTRYLAATAVTTAGATRFPVPRAGMNYRPVIAADRILCLTWGGATPTNAAVVEGWVRVQLGV